MSANIFAQKLDGNFYVIENSDSLYVGRIQVKLEEGSSAVGNAVIRYKFNPNRLSFPENPQEGKDFNLYTFNNGDYVSSVSHPSEDVISVNIAKLFGSDISIINETIDVAEVRFSVKNPSEGNEFEPDVIQFFSPASSEMWGLGNWGITENGSNFEFVNLISPNNGAEALETSINLTWNKINNADYYHLQLSKNEVFTELAYDNSELIDTSIAVNLENSTKYYWRVRYLNDSDTSAYSAKYSFTTKNTNTPQVVLRTPVNDSTIIGSSVMFKWESVSGRDYYQLQLATDENFTNIVKFLDTLHINEIEVNELLSGQVYYWRARASINDDFGKYSTTNKFFIAYANSTKPVLSSPTNNQTNVNTTVTFSWENVDIADYYQIEVAEDENFDDIFYINEYVQNTSQTVYDFEKNKRYYWRVRFKHSTGNSVYSNIFSFETTVGVPTIPTLVTPLNNSVDLEKKLRFTWKNEGVADYYKIEIFVDRGIKELFFSQDSVKETQITVSDFEEGELYYWRVRSTNKNGNSSYTNLFEFNTRMGDPSILTLSEPMNNSIGLENTIRFKWNPIDSAIFYNIEIAYDSDFKNIHFSYDSIYSSEMIILNFNEGFQYYWRITSTNQMSSQTISDIFNFSTHVGMPELPVAISPANNARNIDSEVNFSWSQAENAAFYKLEIAKDKQFKDIIYSEDTLTTNNTTLKNLNEGNKFYWRVKALNSYGISNFTDENRFTIRVNKPTNLRAKVTKNEFINLSWKDNSKVERSFVIERKIKGKNSQNSFVVIDTVSANQSSYDDLSVESNQTYIYRVYSENGLAESDYSNSTELRFSGEMPAKYELSQNYPNPFNPTTTINYSVKEMSDVGIKIYNIIGEEITSLVNEIQDAGNYTLEWSAKDLASGVYIYTMNAESLESNDRFQAVNKMILLK
ncbi:MAG: T9SS type A sorting domain-containing protein [Bacteroidota bacterium]